MRDGTILAGLIKNSASITKCLEPRSVILFSKIGKPELCDVIYNAMIPPLKQLGNGGCGKLSTWNLNPAHVLRSD